MIQVESAKNFAQILTFSKGSNPPCATIESQLACSLWLSELYLVILFWGIFSNNLRYRVNNIEIWLCIDLIVALIAGMSLFASLHASAAEGIQTSFLVENYLSSGYDYMKYCIPVRFKLYSLLGDNYKASQEDNTEMASVDQFIIQETIFNS